MGGFITLFAFFNDTATTEIYTLSLHDALPIFFDSDQWFDKPAHSGYGFGYGLETVLGPIEIKHSWSPETKDHHTWFAVGFWF